jgi:DNA-binding MarR family transcriptional regulator
MGTKRRSASWPEAAERTVQWIDTNRQIRCYEFHDYMTIVAQARYVIRTVQRIIDDCVRSRGLDPLEYQALIQIYGAMDRKLPIGHLAERLDIVSALASRLGAQLESVGLVRRTPSRHDRRATYVSATPKGVARLYAIVQVVHQEVARFRSTLTPQLRRSAFEIMAFYVGSLPGVLIRLPKPERCERGSSARPRLTGLGNARRTARA